MATGVVVRLRKPVPCPICGKPSSQPDHPFCSPRCKDIDLNRWLSGSYVIPGEPVAQSAASGQDEENE